MLTGAVGVWLTMKQNIWCFPIGMINVALYAILFFDPGIRLYADASLQVFYFVLLIYGWHLWTKPAMFKSHILPSYVKGNSWIKMLLLTIMGAIVLGVFLDYQTNADLPWLDSSLTSVSLLAQWMVARKKIENWILWIIADTIYIPLYIHKGLPLTAFLYFIFLLLAVKGFKDWKSTLITAPNVK